ncbi:hypothetical protein DPV79_32955 [Burkholderia reimsis]|uniref:Transposase n=2 Tax=Burkholderia reimsis TaxID=2234132 RepID=A0A365QKB0_9BURK|nr:hypothetical protein DPV79_32955 [Burkholderia reimsis]
MDMRAGFDTALARVVKVFGAAHPHHAYLFANRRANRTTVLIHDGIGIWLAAGRLNQGQFAWPPIGSEWPHKTLDFDAPADHCASTSQQPPPLFISAAGNSEAADEAFDLCFRIYPCRIRFFKMIC